MYFLYLLLFVFFVSCASLKKEEGFFAPGNMDPQDLSLFERAFADMGRENYTSAIPIFEKLSQKYRGKELEWAALYNLAGAYKETGQCQKAEPIYRTLIAKTRKRLNLKARAHLSLAYTYECLGMAERALITLKEGEKHLPHLTEGIRLVEYPARLSLAYLRMDEDKTGHALQKKVYQNMEFIKKSFRISSSADESFSKYFYIIGRSHVKAGRIKPKFFFKMFVYHQTYLTQSMLIQDGKWSAKAERALGDMYRKMWAVIKKQNNKKQYRVQVINILGQLKSIADSSKSKKMLAIYNGLSKKTRSYFKAEGDKQTGKTKKL